MMKQPLRLLCLLLCLTLLPLPALAQETEAAAPLIRVLLRRLNLTDRADLFFDGVYTARTGDGVTMAFPWGSQVSVQLREGQMYLFYQGMSLQVGSALHLTRHVSADQEETGIRFEKTGSFYPGNLSLTIDENGLLRPILTLSVEDYLLGVVPYEMSDSFPLEALKAQAVCARTYALAKVNASRDYDVVDTTNDQVFKGVNLGYEKAVRAVLGKQDGQAVTLEEIQIITELDLSGAGVKRLSDVCRMTALQELNLSDNNLKNLPPLDTLTELRTLNLSGNRLTNFACLKKLSKLETLDITGNLVRDRSVINALPALQNLITEAVTPAPAATPAPNGMFLRRSEKAEPVGDTLTIEVIIGSETRTHTITTTETSVLDALLNAHLISGEEVAWGYNVTMVDGVVANYNAKGEYWVILEYVNGQYESMADSLANRKVRDGDRYAFSLMD